MTTFLLIVSLMAISIVAARLLSKTSKATNKQFLKFADSVPAVLWQEQDGKILWSNETHKKVQKLHGIEPLILSAFSLSGEVALGGDNVRAELKMKDEDLSVPFTISKQSFHSREYFYAQCAIEIANAEAERNRFVQSLSQTFAHLPVGVAVFDRDRDLSLFNPALSNLLDLAPTWLAARPTLKTFLDQLRENGALPEPKNFKSWRQQITRLEKSAANGLYFEDWNLPNGSVYRVTGKPQPKGAVALFVEDISAPVAVEREYRSEIKRLYNGFDSLNLGLIIFYPSGELSFSNTKFDNLWGLETSESVLVPNVVTLTKSLQDKCKPSPVWGDLRDFVASVEERVDWNAQLELLNGQTVEARFVPLPEGQTLCEFSLLDTNLDNKQKTRSTKGRKAS